MKTKHTTTTTEYNLLLLDCIQFYPIFNRHATHKEVETWAEMRHITVLNKTITQIIREVKRRINKTLA